MSYINNALKGKRVLVTGATGFIGGRLAQRLATEEGAIVTGTGRHLEKAGFLQEAGVRLLAADLLDEAAMKTAVADQHIVFHVAAWLGDRSGDAQSAYAVNVTGTENVVRLAAMAGVSRLILVSSINAYGPPKHLNVDESHPLNPNQRDAYGRTKAIGEMRARELANELGLPLVVVRPGMVYGPRAQSWTVGLLKLVQQGTPVIFGDGSGHAYPIYIDNLVDGMLLTAVSPNAPGEAFNFCDPPVDWRTFFDFYARMSGRPARRIPLWAARLLALANEKLHLGLPLTRERLEFYILPASFPTTKAQQLLGYSPRVSLDEGMKQAEIWLKENGYL